MKIAIMGAGAYGTALGGILAANGYDIDYYDSKVEQERLCDVLSGTKLIVLAVPSKAAPYLLPHLPTDIPMVVATKGLLTEGALADFDDWMVLSGPGFAVDIKDKQKTYLTATDGRILEWFKADYMEYELTDDRKGVLMCGALKNVYAIWAGYLGLPRETSEWTSFVFDTVYEMKLILEANGARSETVDLACGIGDVKLTCGYPSRNYEYGDRLRQDASYQPEKTVEGLSAAKRIVNRDIVVPDDAVLLKEIISKIG